MPTTTAESAASPSAPLDSNEVRRVAMVSLGCPKNLVDSEKMLGLLAEDGVLPVPSEAMTVTMRGRLRRCA